MFEIEGVTKIYIGERIDFILGRRILYIVAGRNSTSDFRVLYESLLKIWEKRFERNKFYCIYTKVEQ